MTEQAGLLLQNVRDFPDVKLQVIFNFALT